jgi:hypothetical protein
MRLIPCILLACSLPALTQAADQRVEAVLRANRAAVGSVPQAGSAVYRYGYSGDGLTGESTKTVDLTTGAYVERLDTGFPHTAEGFDAGTPWTRDVSGANTPEQGGDQARVAVSAAYRNANLWWRQDLGGARIEYVGRETLAGTPADHLLVEPHDGVRGTVTVNAPVADLSDAARGSFSDPNFDGNIGWGFLKQFVVTFDYGHQVMYLDRIAPTPPDVGDFDRSGLWINAAKRGYIVTYVAAGSPAAEAGLHAGDVILALDGRAARAEELSNARELLRARPAGTHVPMLVQGKAGSRRIILTLHNQI